MNRAGNMVAKNWGRSPNLKSSKEGDQDPIDPSGRSSRAMKTKESNLKARKKMASKMSIVHDIPVELCLWY